MKITYDKTARVLGRKIRVTDGLWIRLRGWMFQESMEPFDGLYIPWSKSVHNFFVQFPIDVVFINGENQIVKILRNFRPWQISGIYLRARHVIELPAGTVDSSISEGDYLKLT